MAQRRSCSCWKLLPSPRGLRLVTGTGPWWAAAQLGTTQLVPCFQEAPRPASLRGRAKPGSREAGLCSRKFFEQEALKAAQNLAGVENTGYVHRSCFLLVGWLSSLSPFSAPYRSVGLLAVERADFCSDLLGLGQVS